MGRMCGTHEQFIQDGETCRYCETSAVAEVTPAAPPRPAPTLQRKEYMNRAPGTYYSDYDILDVGGGPRDLADISHWETAAVRQQNGLTLPAYPLKIDPSLRADLAAAWDAAEVQTAAKNERLAFLVDVMSAIRELTERVVALQKKIM